MGSPSQSFTWFNERGFPFVFLSVTVSEGSEGISQSAQRFQAPLKAFRGARGDFRGFGKDFAERTEVSESSGRHFAERAAVSEDSEGISRSAQPFPRTRKAFCGVRSCFRGLGKHFSPFKSYFRIVDEQKTRIFRDPIYGLLIV